MNISNRELVFFEGGFDRDPNEEPGNDFNKMINRLQYLFITT